MVYNPKTPMHYRSRSDATSSKTPLTPSLIAGLSNVFIASPTKSSSKQSGGSGTPNPFLSRPSSPVKRSTSGGIPVSATLKRQASIGVIRKGGVEAKMDVVSRDYVPPKQESKRSQSQPASVKVLDHVPFVSSSLMSRRAA